MPETGRIWFFHNGIDRAGPYPETEIQAKIARGEIQRDHYVWCEGMPTWKKVTETELARAFVASPPPLSMEPTLTKTEILAAPSQVESFAATGTLSKPSPELARTEPTTVNFSTLLAGKASPQPEDGLSALIEVPSKRHEENTAQIDAGQLRTAKREAAKATKIAQKAQKKFESKMGLRKSPLFLFMGACLIVGFGYLVVSGALPELGSIQSLFSPIPKLPDLPEQDYQRLIEAAKAKSGEGARAELALARLNPETPVFYVASNSQGQDSWWLQIDPVAPSLVDEPPAPVRAPVGIVDHFGKTAPIRTRDGKAMPRGKYRVQLLGADRRLVVSREVFLGGQEDSAYVAQLKDFHQKRRQKAQSELDELKNAASKLEAQLLSLNQVSTEVVRQRSKDARARTWSQGSQAWIAADGEIEKAVHGEAHFTRRLRQNAEQTLQSVRKARDAYQASLLASGYRVQLSEAAKETRRQADSDISQLKAALEGAAREFSTGNGYLNEQ